MGPDSSRILALQFGIQGIPVTLDSGDILLTFEFLADRGEELPGVGQGLLGVVGGDLEGLAVVGAKPQVECGAHPAAKLRREQPPLDDEAGEASDSDDLDERGRAGCHNRGPYPAETRF